MTYAIDFGTSNTLIARWNEATQAAEAVTLSGLSVGFGAVPALIPSLIYVADASVPLVVVGQQVRDRGLDVVSDRRFSRGLSGALAPRYRAICRPWRAVL